MEDIILNNGVKMPILGFGVYQISDAKLCEESVIEAIKIGYRLIDTATVYGNEEAVGKAIKKSGVERKDLFITTKLWIQDAGYESAKKAFETSLNKLQLDYLDLYLIHQPFGDVYGAWRAMEELYKEGKIRAIGVSNFASDRLVDLSLNNKITPMINQVEVHPFYQQVFSKKIMEEYNVQIEGWAPFAEGKQNLFSNETLVSIGKKYGKSAAQVTLRWHIQRKTVVIPKSTHKERIKENFNIFDFQLSDNDMKIIEDMDKNKGLFVVHEDPSFVKSMNSYKIH